MRRAFLVLAVAAIARADEAAAWKWSAAAVSAASVADVATSWPRPGYYEANPILRGGDGQLAPHGIAIKAGVVVGVLLLERRVGRNNPRAMRVFSRINWAIAGATGAVAAHNASIRRGSR